MNLNTIDPRTFHDAARLVDTSGIVDLVTAWSKEDLQDTGSSEELRAVIVGWLATALAGRSRRTESVAQLLSETRGAKRVCHVRVKAVTRSILELIDYAPLPDNDGPLTNVAFQDALRMRADMADVLAEKRRRHLMFTNALLRTQLNDIEACSGTNISVALGTMFLGANVEGNSPTAPAGLGSDDLVSEEPDAVFLTRTYRQESKTYFGWRCEVAHLVSNDALRPDSVPNIVVAFTGCRPEASGTATTEIAQELATLEHGLGRVIGDTTDFPDLESTDVQTALRQRGATLVTAYADAEEGLVRARENDSILVEGRWYANDLPAHLRMAMVEYREASRVNDKGYGRVADEHQQVSIEERRDALLASRQAYEVLTPVIASGDPSPCAYGTREWRAAVNLSASARRSLIDAAAGRRASRFTKGHDLRGAAAHSFIKMLDIAATNAAVITEWKRSHAHHQGRGMLKAEGSVLFSMVATRLQRMMADWSQENQADAVNAATEVDGWGGYWSVVPDENEWFLSPEEATVSITMNRADDDSADVIAQALFPGLRDQADAILEEASTAGDLSHEMSIVLCFEFPTCMFNDDDLDVPMSADGEPVLCIASLESKSDLGSRGPELFVF